MPSLGSGLSLSQALALLPPWVPYDCVDPCRVRRIHCSRPEGAGGVISPHAGPPEGRPSQFLTPPQRKSQADGPDPRTRNQAAQGRRAFGQCFPHTCTAHVELIIPQGWRGDKRQSERLSKGLNEKQTPEAGQTEWRGQDGAEERRKVRRKRERSAIYSQTHQVLGSLQRSVQGKS